MRTEKSYCRICSGLCGVSLTIDDDDRIVDVRGDRDHPLTRGYACIKGLQAAEIHYGEDRLLHPLKRLDDGSLVRVPLEQALDEIAGKLRHILDRDGPDAVAAYRGTINVYSASAAQMLPDWLHSLGSSAYYTTMTIDQSAKWVTYQRLGAWMAGKQSLADADVMLYAGINPLVSIGGSGLAHNPTKTIKEARARGVKLIVIDPRRSETAAFADIHLRPLPGEDAAVAAGLLHIVLREGWHDAEFCSRFVENLGGLWKGVEPFTPERVARQSTVSAADLHAAAELFARPDGAAPKRGTANAGTGITMSPNGNLADHLYECLNVVCGRFPRAGECVPHPGLMMPAGMAVQAAVVPPARAWEQGWKSRIGGYGMLFGERMTVELADEILTPGAGQIKSLFVDGGNPVSAIPDQEKVVRAFRELELLVTVDPYLSTTAQLSHYVLPPKVFYEHADMLADKAYAAALFPKPLAAYTPAIVPAPAGSDLTEDWYVFWSLAKRLGVTVTFDGVELDMDTPPTVDDLHAILLRHGPVDLATLRRHRGEVLPLDPVTVQAAPASATGRFAVAPDDVLAELDEVSREGGGDPRTRSDRDDGFTHLLISRRIREVSNSTYQQLSAVRRRMPYNPLWVHPEDLAALDLQEGEAVCVVSEHGRVTTAVEADDTMKRGVVALTHGWGGLPEDQQDFTRAGVSVTRLVSSTEDLETINAMPRQSAIPVRLERVRWGR